MKFNLIYITAKDKKEAEKIANMLLKAKLAACVNIIGGINSIYRWNGKIARDKEAILIAKTKKSLVKKVVKKVKSIHSYSCPCIVALPIAGGSREYLDWIKKETV